MPPTATGTLPLTRLGFGCRLPVSNFAWSSSRQGGFIQFPGADYAEDPKGNGGQTYDAAFNKWLPVPRSNVSPDGARYVLGYNGDPDHIRVVDVRSGKATDWPVPPAGPPGRMGLGVWAPIDFASDGIYVVFDPLVKGWEGIKSGIWRLDPNRGSLSQVANVQFWSALHDSSGVFWTVVFDQADTGPRVLPFGYGNEVIRIDTATGNSERWLYEPGYALAIAAVDQQGSLVVVAQDSTGTWRVLMVTGAGKAATVYSGTTTVGYQGAVADAHGVWFIAMDGVYFLSVSTGFVRVSEQTSKSPAGGCT